MSLPAHILIFRCHSFDRRDAQPAWVTIHLLITNTGRLSANPVTGHIQMSYTKHTATGAPSILGASQEHRGIGDAGPKEGQDPNPVLHPPKEQQHCAASKPPLYLLLLFMASLCWQLLCGELSTLAAASPQPRLGGSPARRRAQSPLSTTLIISGFP